MMIAIWRICKDALLKYMSQHDRRPFLSPTAVFLLLFFFLSHFQVGTTSSGRRDAPLTRLRGGKTLEFLCKQSLPLPTPVGRTALSTVYSNHTLRLHAKKLTLRNSTATAPSVKKRVCDICKQGTAVVGRASPDSHRTWAARACRQCVRNDNTTNWVELHRRCLDCSRFAVFAKSGRTKKHCRQHCRSKEERDVVNRRCSFAEGCARQPSFGDSHDGTARFCSQHRMRHHIVLKNPRCAHLEGCALRAQFERGGVKLCGKHRSFVGIPALDAKSELLRDERWQRACEIHGCPLPASYGTLELRKPQRCRRHRHGTDVDVKKKRCQGGLGECLKSPSFGSNSEGIARYCFDHKPEGCVDVRSRRCDLCPRRATWGTRGSGLSRCKEHRLPYHTRPEYASKAKRRAASVGPKGGGVAKRGRKGGWLLKADSEAQAEQAALRGRNNGGHVAVAGSRNTEGLHHHHRQEAKCLGLDASRVAETARRQDAEAPAGSSQLLPGPASQPSTPHHGPPMPASDAMLLDPALALEGASCTARALRHARWVRVRSGWPGPGQLGSSLRPGPVQASS